jgi:hypothetical protein
VLDWGDQREEIGWGVCVECVRSALEEDERGESLRAGPRTAWLTRKYGRSDSHPDRAFYPCLLEPRHQRLSG